MPLHPIPSGVDFRTFHLHRENRSGPMSDNGGGGSALAYHALAPDENGLMQGVLVGPGDVSEGRFSDILLPDYQSVYKTFGSGDLGWEDGRVVSGTEVYATDDGGQPLLEMPWLVHAPQATNHLPNDSRDPTGWPDIGSVDLAVDSVGIDGAANSCATYTSQAGTSVVRSDYTPALGGAGTRMGYVQWVLKETAETQFPILSSIRSGNNVNAGCGVNEETGYTWPIIAGAVTDIQEEALDEGLWWRVVISWEVAAAVQIRTTISPARGIEDNPNFNSGVAGESCVCDANNIFTGFSHEQVKVLPPIFNSGVAVTRDTCALALTELHTVWNATEGTLYLETFITGDSPLLSSAGSDFLSIENGFAKLTDGVHTTVAPFLNPTNIAVVYGDNGMMYVTANGAKSPEVPYEGSLVSTLVEAYKDALVVQKVRNLKYWDAADASKYAADMPAAPDYTGKTVLVVETTSANEQWDFRCDNVGTYNAVIDWGDGGATDNITAYNDAALVHTYASPGRHQVEVTGSLPKYWTGNDHATDLNKIKGIVNLDPGVSNQQNTLGNGALIVIAGAFPATTMGSQSFYQSPVYALDAVLLANVTNISSGSQMFISGGLTYIPADFFPITASAITIEAMFNGTDLATAEAGLLDSFGSVTNADYLFANCNLGKLPSGLLNAINVNLTTAFQLCYNNPRLADVPANMFDGLSGNDLNLNQFFNNCGLTQQSVDNILESLDVSGITSSSGYTIGLSGGTNSPPSATGLAAKTSLEGKGWTVTVNS